MMFALITMFAGLAMSITAATFAIFGIVAMFAGMPMFAVAMGAVIELGKVVGVTWLYRNWYEPTKIKYAMLPVVTLSLLLTSLGIFGMLSKAHLEQTSPVANNEIQIVRLDQQIAREQSKITDAEQVISQLDQSVQALIDFDRIRGPDGALAVRESQAEQRELLRQTIDTAQSEVDRLEDQKLELTQELSAIALEVGPVKYLAELVYGDGTDRTEEAVRWVIIAFIFVFDPMAILLLMAANYTLDQRKKRIAESTTVIPEVKEPVIKEEIRVEQDKNEPVIDTTDSTSEPEQPVFTEPEPISEPEPVVETKQPEPEPEPVHENREANITEQLSIGPDIVEEFDEIISAPKKQQNKQIPLDNVTLCDVGGGYVEYNNHLYQKDALKEINPELFRLKPDQPSMPNSGFGTAFPKIAQKKDIFVRVDVIPNKVYRFEGSKWIEINKNLSSTYLYDQEYIKYLIDKISNGEYDIELLSEQEKNQIDEYLNTQNQYK